MIDPYHSPSCSFAASDIRSFVQPGSHTTSTFASVTPGNASTFVPTSTGSDCAAGQPGAVSVIVTPRDAGRVDEHVVDQARAPRC